MANITDFVGKFTNMARANLFEVVIDNAPGASDGSNLKFLAKNAQLPGRSLGTVPVKYQNNTINYPGDVAIAELSLTVMNDESYNTRKLFESWMESYKNLDQTLSDTWTSWYAGKITVYPLDPLTGLGKKPKYSFLHAFPSDLGAIDLSWDSADTIQEYSVTFTYSYWTKEE